MEEYLEVVSDAKSTVVSLVGRTVIGRSSANDVVLSDDLLVSRTHAVVERYGGGWALRDLGTPNGTYINGRKIEAERILRPGDEIRLGNSRILYQARSVDDSRGTIRMDHREHITILFTDMVGSTERYVNLSLGTADEVRRQHFSLLRQAIDTSGGHEVKNLGDGVMVELPSAPAALQCAVSMQQAVNQENRATDNEVGLRIGASCGEVTHEVNDYFGPAVIEASRLCAMAEGGQILVADALRTVVGRRTHHLFHRRSGLALKGFNETVTAYEVRWEPRDR